jgi:iron complex outermembrane receptor protein
VRNPTRQLLIAVKIAAIVGLSVPEVSAQTDAETVLEEVVVTARKLEESLMETPVSITAFTAEDLAVRQIYRIDQISDATPNLIYRSGAATAGTSGAATVFIRGVGQTDFTLVTEPGVGVYLDGVYISQTVGGVLDLIDVASVEVLRGPQGTLFGRNTIGGAINIVSEKPDDQFGGNVELIAGERDRFDAKGSVNIPLGDRVFTKFSFLTFNQDGFIEQQVTGEDTGDTDTWSARGAARWVPTDHLEVNFAVDYTEERENGAPEVLLGPFDPNALFAFFHNIFVAPGLVDTLGDDAFYDQNARPSELFAARAGTVVSSNMDLWGTNLTVDWDVGPFLIKSITSYRDLESTNGRDQDLAPVVVAETLDVFNQEQFSQEIQLSGKGVDERLQWLVGFYHFDEEGFNEDVVRFSPVHVLSGAQIDYRIDAAFGQLIFDLTDKLSLTAGMRYSDERRTLIIPENLQVITMPIPPADAILGIAAGDRLLPVGETTTEISEWTPHLNLAYQWTDDLMTYVSYSEGFKGGGFSQRIFPGLPEVDSFEPEFAEVYEAGIKVSGFENRLRLTGAAFHTDYTDVQVQINIVAGGVVAAVTRNAAAASISGFELEATALPIPRLLISGGIGYLDAEYDEIGADVVGVTIDHELPYAPEWQLNASISYDFPFLEGRLTPRVDWSYTDELYNDAVNTPLLRQEGYHLVNASLTYMPPSENWDIALLVQNMTDTKYIIQGTFFASNGFAQAGFGEPREIAARFRYRF